MKETKKKRAASGTRASAAGRSNAGSGKKRAKKTGAAALAKPRPKRAAAATAKPRPKGATASRVADHMARPVYVCQPTESCAAAATKMWKGDCGALPVVDPEGRLSGWITDRDICMALAMERGSAAGELAVEQAMNTPVHSCRSEDPVSTALEVMADQQVRRLAVVDDSEQLVGVLSITDLVRAAKARRSAGIPSGADVLDAIRRVSRPHEAPAG